jgi:hypothetical protein
MGATLRYAKVIDRTSFANSGGQIRPGLDSEVRVPDDGPATADPFLILRAWDDVDAAFTETWRIVEPHGRTVIEGTPREVLADHGDIADELDDVGFEYADSGYQLVLEVDGREVARADFPVRSGPPPAG